MKANPEAKGVSDSMIECMVTAMMKYADQTTSQGIADGKINVDNDFKAFGEKEKQVQEEMSKCA